MRGAQGKVNPSGLETMRLQFWQLHDTRTHAQRMVQQVHCRAERLDETIEPYGDQDSLSMFNSTQASCQGRSAAFRPDTPPHHEDAIPDIKKQQPES
jgi:hypothetical protein